MDAWFLVWVVAAIIWLYGLANWYALSRLPVKTFEVIVRMQSNFKLMLAALVVMWISLMFSFG